MYLVPPSKCYIKNYSMQDANEIYISSTFEFPIDAIYN